MEWLVLIGFVVVALFFAWNRGGSQAEGFPYVSQEVIFSPAERSFFGVLSKVVEKNAVVLGKVRIADVIKPRRGLSRSEWQIAFNKISAKHFDYLICTPDTLSVIAVVELDDRSHARKERIERDQFVVNACLAAGITLHRVKAEASYNLVELRELIFPPAPVGEPVLGIPENVVKEFDEPNIESTAKQARCPKCSSELVLRVAKKGNNKGSEFLGCSAFPKCRYVESKKS